MLVNQASIAGLFTNFNAIFQKAFEGYKPQWQKTAMLSPSKTAQEDYTWLSDWPKMRKWLGDKAVKQLAAFKYSIVNDEMETTINVLRRHILNDNMGLYLPQIQNAAVAGAEMPDDLIDDLKNGAFTTACYDSQYYYDTDHPVGQANNPDNPVASVSNKGTAALSAATTAAATASYGAGRLAIQKFKSDTGRQLKLTPDTLEVPAALEATANLLMTSPKLTDESPNPYIGTAEVLVNTGLTSDTAWFLHVTKRPVKPYIYQQNEAPHLVKMTNPESEKVFMQGVYLFGLEAYCAAGYGPWQMSYGSVGTG